MQNLPTDFDSSLASIEMQKIMNLSKEQMALKIFIMEQKVENLEVILNKIFEKVSQNDGRN